MSFRSDLVSIIVPCKNVPEEFLKDLHNSFLASTHMQYEVLLCDDHSDAQFRQLLEALTLRDFCFRIVEVEGNGVSCARNAGLTAARGDYVAFADADDWIAPTFIEDALGILVDKQVDAVFGHSGCSAALEPVPVGDMTVFDSNNIDQLQRVIASGTKLSLANFYQGADLGYVWAKLYRKDALDGLRFKEGIRWGEDFAFNVAFSMKAGSIAVADAAWYGYRRHSGSATAGTADDLLEKMRQLDALYPDYQKAGIDRNAFCVRCFHAYANAFLDCLRFAGLSEAKRLLKGLYRLPGMAFIDDADFSGLAPSRNKRELLAMFKARSVAKAVIFAQTLKMRDALRG